MGVSFLSYTHFEERSQVVKQGLGVIRRYMVGVQENPALSPLWLKNEIF
jgi:hypothetical protein